MSDINFSEPHRLPIDGRLCFVIRLVHEHSHVLLTRAVGIDIACKRIAKELAQPRMFNDPPPEPPKQQSML